MMETGKNGGGGKREGGGYKRKKGGRKEEARGGRKLTARAKWRIRRLERDKEGREERRRAKDSGTEEEDRGTTYQPSKSWSRTTLGISAAHP